MEYELCIIVDKILVSSQEVVKRDTLKIYDVKRPESILDFGQNIGIVFKIKSK